MSEALSAIVSLIVVASAAADPPEISLPDEIQGRPSAFVTVRAATEGKIVRWVALSDGLNVFPSELLRDSRVTVVVAGVPGRYRLLAYTAAGDEPSEPAVTTVVIAGPTPPPVPPDPPGPNPPPDPTDPLTKKIRDALASDPGTPEQKRTWAAALAGFYTAMSAHVGTGQVDTVGDLLADYRNAIPAVLPTDAIPATRQVAGKEVAAVAGDDAAKKIDERLRLQLSDLFARLAAAMTIEARR